MVASGPEPACTAAFLTLGPAVFFVLFFSDFDAKIGQVILIKETLRRHTWGAIPGPAF